MANPRDRSGKSYAFTIHADGTFTIDDVEPGMYAIIVEFYRFSADDHRPTGERVGGAHHEFIVDPIAGGRSDEALELGEIEVKRDAERK